MARPITAARSVFAISASFALLLALAGGCSSKAADTAAGDFCSDARSSNLKCKEPSDCDAQLGNNCASLSTALSPATLSAARDCLQSGVCGVASCVSRAAKNTTPTAAHKKLAEDFCTFCAPSLQDCVANFYKRGSRSAGLGVLPYSDEVAQAIDDGCTGQSGCQAKFQKCASGVIAEKVAAGVDADTATCIVQGFHQDDSEQPLGPDGKPQAVTCTPANCNGCCRDDRCEKGDSTTACGVGAKGCETCSTTTALCSAGKCKEPCGPSTCNGCCAGDTCVLGTAKDKCGLRGASCDACAGQFVCSNHTCVDGSCLATCTNGCCSATGCKPGNAPSACGTGGEGCVDCGVGRTCSAASCLLDRTSLWDFYISFAVVPDKDKNGKSWHVFDGLPDPYLLVFTSEATASHSGATTTKTATTVPFWQETPLKSVKASELLSNTSVEIWDYHVLSFDSFMGGCQLPLVPAMFDGSILHHYVCPATASGVSVEVYYRINPHK